MSAPAATLAFVALLMLPAAGACAESDVLFPPATAGCYVGAEISRGRRAALSQACRAGDRRAPRAWLSPACAGRDAGAHRRGRPPDQLAGHRDLRGCRQARAPKRYANGLYECLRCSADACDAGNYKVERQSDGTVLLRMTGGMNVGGGRTTCDRRLPDGHIYRLAASPMAAGILPARQIAA